MNVDDFTAVLERRAVVPSRIESGEFQCWAFCGACSWRGPKHGGDANAAHEAAKEDLRQHYIDQLADEKHQKAA